ncbi:hypothetical protein [Desulforhopalus singaporensis]|uniref:Uncharacterized protein n=1 Tax=Desulforhopalus singaporensis TaxID=91360 RepID=A0A1H0RRK4_9BACT|nr:hypothetical protein [Desulforhopalus singaporensis]SDP32134.1 hypothetical protein SAMN05660330_02394 [Desulforhopalus singaporensis]SDP60005.1 hypothetical protein SAMN05660330_03330 [Desulforhopalus singaporensis]
MATDWSKVLEVFGSGIVGVFVVMLIVQLLTQASTWVIDVIERRRAAGPAEPKPENQSAPAKG